MIEYSVRFVKTNLRKKEFLLKRFVEAVIVKGRITHEPAKHLKSMGRRQKNNWKDIKNGAKSHQSQIQQHTINYPFLSLGYPSMSIKICHKNS